MSQRLRRPKMNQDGVTQSVEMFGTAARGGVHSAEENIGDPEKWIVRSPDMSNAQPTIEALALQRHDVGPITPVLRLRPLLENCVMHMHRDELVVQHLQTLPSTSFGPSRSLAHLRHNDGHRRKLCDSPDDPPAPSLTFILPMQLELPWKCESPQVSSNLIARVVGHQGCSDQVLLLSARTQRHGLVDIGAQQFRGHPSKLWVRV